jgi:sugar phosphate permease
VLTAIFEVGNARTLGMQKDLNLTDAQWNLCLTIFFFPYAVFEVPSNIVLKFIKPNVWLACLLVAWGTTTTLTGLVRHYHGLLAARFFLGVAEVCDTLLLTNHVLLTYEIQSGFFPAATYLLTCWYCRHEMQGRLSVFFCAGSLAGAFSGLLAYAIQKMDGVGGLDGWRWYGPEQLHTLTILTDSA